LRALHDCYRTVARPWSEYDLARRYQAADERGAAHLPAGAALNRPIPLLTAAIPALVTLAVAANTLHMLQFLATEQPEFWNELVTKLDTASAGSLHRLKLALQVENSLHHVGLDEWTPTIYDEAEHALSAFDADADPPSLIEHAHEASRWTAIAIEAIDRDTGFAAEAIADALAQLLAVCVFAEIITER
jgi:hypothetical protein